MVLSIIVGTVAIIVVIALLRKEFHGRWERQRFRDKASEELNRLIIESEMLISAYQDYRLHTASVVYRAEKIDKQITGTVKNIEAWVKKLGEIIRPTYEVTDWYKRHKARYDLPAVKRTMEEKMDRWLWLNIVGPIGSLIYRHLYQRMNPTTREDVKDLKLAHKVMSEVFENLALALEHIEYAITPTIKAKDGKKITPVEFRDQMVNGQVEARKGERKPMKSWQKRKDDKLKEK